MKLKKFYAKNTREGMNIVKKEFGENAVIFSNKKKGNGVEILAALDVQDSPSKNNSAIISNSSSNKVQEYSLVEGKVIDDSLPFINKNISEEYLDEYKTEIQELNSIVEVESPQEKTILNLQSEIKSLRSLLEEQLSGIIWDKKNRKNPNQAHILRKLASYGFSSEISKNLIHNLSSQINLEEAWLSVKEKLISSLRHITSQEESLHGSYVFLGPTGSGKTLTIAKIAAQYAIKYGSDKVAILNCDGKRIGSFEQLKIYGRILDVTVKNVDNSEELNKTLSELESKKIILIDTPGLSITNPKLHDCLSMFNESSLMLKFMLVLPSNVNYNFAIQCCKFYSKIFRLSSVIVTKMDECFSLGGIISVLLEEKIKLSFISDGHAIPDDLSVAKAAYLVQKAFSQIIVASKNSDDDIARNFLEENVK